ncbi:alpha/beta fold hydrolase [Pseudoxanthomonas sp. PXM04]|uniref:alpha/beta fold hydrolase n=1 Tax=Pseudoxanthomonas sp. PXM04 TaxID=2769297 RepID=UPI00177E776F|nr:alpha/beta fold hydrolase [Pseudoxanthomonas sp. PXM04]MBD9376091.1 alpha/beta fold hydrolase [Pseudoxanthomonas sp. PXM04]
MPERGASAWSALFLHGAGGGGWEWNLWSGIWRAQGIAVNAPDLQPADAGLEATEWEDYRRQAAAWLAALPRPRVLVGASMGGLLALQAAAEADALVAINPLPPAPLHTALPAREWPARVAWRRHARLASTRRAMPESDPASILYALRRWRDESGAVLRAAQSGIEIPMPDCPALFMASRRDGDVPAQAVRRLAGQAGGAFVELGGDHLAPLMGRDAPRAARQAVEWLNAAAATV